MALHQITHTHNTQRDICEQFNSVVLRASIATVIQYRKKRSAVKEGGGEEDSGGGVVFGYHATPCHAPRAASTLLKPAGCMVMSACRRDKLASPFPSLPFSS